MKMQSQVAISFLAVLLVVCFTLVSKAEDTNGVESKMKDPQAKVQMHESMSVMHKKAADCLRSGKSE